LEEKPIGPDKNNNFNESSWFGEPNCKLMSEVGDFFVFLFFFIDFTLVAQFFLKWKASCKLKTLLRTY
jgi:hypothetical protein